MKKKSKKFILWFEEISKRDVSLVGGKNASLGEMFSKLTKRGINIPNGFALTTQAYWHFFKENKLEEKLKEIFEKLESGDIKSLRETGRKSRELILRAEFPEDLKGEIFKAYQKLSQIYNQKDVEVAVRSSGVAEDAPTMSFAGQFETFLNVSGKKNLLTAIKKCFASAFGDRVIAYREEKKVPHLKFALSVGIQKMVRSDLASSGVMFTLDTETGFKNVVLINSIYGVGEMIVKGKITPDEFLVFKPTLERGYKPIIVKKLGRKTKKYIWAKGGGLKEVKVAKNQREQFSLNDEEILTLAKWGIIIERHYGLAQDIEWAKDGETNQLFIVQSRPETVYASKEMGRFYQEYKIKTKKKPILTGIAVGNKIGQGKVQVISDVSKMEEFKKGGVLVTKMTDPDWLPVMRIASAIVTDEGGRVCHAAIVSRELGIPCIVGTKKATKILKNGQEITVDCSQEEGRIFLGKVPFETKRYDLKRIPKLKTKIMINIGAPEIAFKTSFLPNDGVGLARIEFILTEKIRIHPLALYHFEKIKKRKIKSEIERLTFGYKDKTQYFIDKLAEGIAQIAAAFWPKPVIVRFSDFKSNEYKALIGGELFEPEESNPMLGWRGASRYYDEKFRPAFEMEIEAVKKVRNVFGLKNIWVMIPFCRTVKEGKKVLEIMKKKGLKRREEGLKVIVMCEIPSNVILAEKFLKIFDGFSIGSNDLTQCLFGLDRDNAQISHIANEFHEASREMIKRAISVCNKMGKYSGICGDAPSTIEGFAQFLIDCKIQSISLSPDAVIKTLIHLSQKADKKS